MNIYYKKRKGSWGWEGGGRVLGGVGIDISWYVSMHTLFIYTNIYKYSFHIHAYFSIYF